jgi:telomere length regulation protein
LKERSEYGALWKEILDGLDSRTRIGIVHGFFFHLTDRIVLSQVDGEPQRKPEVGIKLGADLLIRFFGSNAVDVKDTIVDTLLPLVISKDKSFDVRSSLQQGSSSSSSSSWERMGVRARVFVAVVEKQGRALTGTVLKRVMEVWGDEREVRWGLLGRRSCESITITQGPGNILLISQNSVLTLLIILLVSTLPPFDPLITQITFHSPFLVAMQSYLGHSDPAIRRLGMLIGEIISIMSIREEDSSDPTETKGKDEIVDELEGMLDNLDVDEADLKRENKNIPPPKVKRLDFGKDMWDGTGGGKEESRWLRSFFRLRDRNAIGAGELQMLGWQAGTGGNAGLHTSDLSYSDEAVRGRPAERQARRQTKAPKSNPVVVDSDDESLVGYSDSSPSSSRSPSPTPSYLEEVANDPMLNTSTRAKVQRPVYLIQLIELLKARTEPEKLEVGLRWGEELIRRKRNFGSELGESRFVSRKR